MTSSDPSEIARFAALSDHWWDPAGELSTLHAINPIRLEFIQRHAPAAGKHVIDVGCGGGLLTEGLASLGAHVTGIDLCGPALSSARQHALQSGLKIDYIEQSADEMSDQFPDRFDIVTCLEMLEHSPDPAAIVAACARLAKPGGDLFFSTINRTAKAWLFAILGAEYLFRLLPKNTHDYSRFIPPATLVRWMSASGLECVHMTGLHYHPFTKKASLTQDVSVNYLIHARKT